MKIATWNLESLRPLTRDRKVAFRNAMADVKADAWVITETWIDFEPPSGYALGAQSSKAEDLKNSGRCWVSIWVKSSLTHEQMEIECQSDRMAAVQIKNSYGQAIFVVGTVLPWPSDKLWPGAKKYCEALDQQTAEWDRLRGNFGDCTFVVAGDFNHAIPYQRWYGSKAGAKKLSETLGRPDFGLDCLTQGDDQLTGKPRIDHICIGRNGLLPSSVPQVETWETPCITGRQITDHSGVAVDLQLLNGTYDLPINALT